LPGLTRQPAVVPVRQGRGNETGGTIMTTLTQHIGEGKAASGLCDDRAATEVADSAATPPDEHVELEVLKGETLALDIGVVAQSADETFLYKYMKRRFQISAEAERLKDQMAAMVRDQEAHLKALDYLFQKEAQAIVAGMISGKKTKSIKTPWGTAGFRAYPKRIELVDEEALIKQAQDEKGMDHLIQTDPRPNKEAINKHFAETGELPAGCELIPPGDRFYVK
jgi:hypothetical protein